DGVLLDRLAVIGADGASIGFFRIGSAHDLPQVTDRVVALQRRDVDRTGHHVFDEIAEERALSMDRVKAFGFSPREADFLDAEEPEAFRFDAADDFSEISLADRVRF